MLRAGGTRRVVQPASQFLQWEVQMRIKAMLLAFVVAIPLFAYAKTCTDCRAEYARCMEHSKTLGDQKACKDTLAQCEKGCTGG